MSDFTLQEFMEISVEPRYITDHRGTKIEGHGRRPRVKCKDGLSFSLQAGRGMYSVPNVWAKEYDSVELGFPSEKVEEFMPFVEPLGDPVETIYRYVPFKIVEKVIKDHGGFHPSFVLELKRKKRYCETRRTEKNGDS